MKSFILLTVAVAVDRFADSQAAENLLSPVDQASTSDDSDSPWATTIWTGDGRFDVVDGGRDGGKCLLLEADASGGDISWIHPLELEADTEYHLSGWVKTENLKGSTGRGIVIHFDGDERPTKEVSGTNDWTLLESTFRTTGRNNTVHCSLGGWGLATGRVWLDDIRVEKVVRPTNPKPTTTQIKVTIDAGKSGERINPFIYGQFIEHLGRCIYGGIWAEMLEDRKFYFPITDKYDPYRDLEDSEFPVVGASPWEIIGPAGRVTMVKEDAVRRRAHAAGRRRQRHPAERSWPSSPARSTSATSGSSRAATATATAEVTLAWGDGDDQTGRSIDIGGVGTEYKKFPFEFTAGASTDKARLDDRRRRRAVPRRHRLADAGRQRPRHAPRHARAAQAAQRPDLPLARRQFRQRLRLARRHRRPRPPPAAQEPGLDRRRAQRLRHRRVHRLLPRGRAPSR